MIFQEGTLYIEGSDFIRNSWIRPLRPIPGDEKDGYGGAIATLDVFNVEIKSSSFEKNSARKGGGAIWLNVGFCDIYA